MTTPTVGPPAEMQEIVAKVVPIADADLAAFYADFADVVKRDTDVIKTTGDIREAHIRAGKLMFQQTGMDGKYIDLDVNVDAAIEAALGKKSVPLTPELRAKAVEVFEALSWAFQ